MVVHDPNKERSKTVKLVHISELASTIIFRFIISTRRKSVSNIYVALQSVKNTYHIL
jgi:hypothetical protein